ncbi:MAG: hypothetical protein ACRC7N_03235 [Clostridium sp.]
MVCNFNFKNVYGGVGKGFIGVHHLKPLSELNEEVTISLAICSNCNRMIYKKILGACTVEELKVIIGTYRLLNDKCTINKTIIIL